MSLPVTSQQINRTNPAKKKPADPAKPIQEEIFVPSLGCCVLSQKSHCQRLVTCWMIVRLTGWVTLPCWGGDSLDSIEFYNKASANWNRVDFTSAETVEEKTSCVFFHFSQNNLSEATNFCAGMVQFQWAVFARVSHENTFWIKKSAQPGLQVFGGYFESKRFFNFDKF